LISFFGGKTIHTFTSSGTFVAPASITSVEYVVVGGGGAGGGSTGASGRGGGGAGGYRSATGYTIPAGTYSIQVGAGAGNANSPNGTSSKFYQGASTLIEGTGGGSGGTAGGNPGGSGGGTGASPVGSTVSSPDGISPTTQGFGGGSYGNGAGGGGGAGGAGGDGGDPGPWPSVYAGGGGIGVQLPATFRNPVSSPGPLGGGLGMPGPSGSYWVAGGGGGSRVIGLGNLGYRYGRGGYGPAGNGSNFSSDTPIGYAGAGNGAPVDTGTAGSGIENTGGGGGGGALGSGSGGSGIVLIAYPS
jgi:hypothetical protein